MNMTLTAKKTHAKRTLSAAFVIVALALTSACGGGADRPSKDEIVKGLTKSSGGAITDKQAECVAKIVLDSKLSAESLQALADSDAKYKPSKDDKALEAKLTEKLAGCLK